MTGCPVKHDNPYCSTTERKIKVDVEHEYERIDAIKRASGKSWTPQIQDSLDRIRAAETDCAKWIGKGARTGYYIHRGVRNNA